MTLMNKFTHITKLILNFEAELRGTNPGEIRSRPLKMFFHIPTSQPHPITPQILKK